MKKFIIMGVISLAHLVAAITAGSFIILKGSGWICAFPAILLSYVICLSLPFIVDVGDIKTELGKPRTRQSFKWPDNSFEWFVFTVLTAISALLLGFAALLLYCILHVQLRLF